MVKYNHLKDKQAPEVTRAERIEKMARYFINGQEVTKEQAEEQQKINDELMKIEDITKWLEAMKQAEFIVRIGD